MTSQERVLLAIDHCKTDRAPCDYEAHQSVTDRLVERLGVADYEELLQALGVDLRRISFDYGQPPSEPDADGYRRDMWGIRFRESDPGDGQPNWIAPFNEDTTLDEALNHKWPSADALDYSKVKEDCERYYGTYATYGAPWSPFFHEIGNILGQPRFYMWMIEKPDVVKAIIDGFVNYEVEVTRRFLEATDGMLDVAFFGNDFGTQRGLVISPRMWEEFMRAPLKRFYDVSREHGCKVMQHSCGAVRDIIPMLMEDGVDVMDPIQVAAANMDFRSLVSEFGDRLAFHGGIDTQGLLPFGSVDDVRAGVRSFLDLMRDSGGYILQGSQLYIDDIPLDNILAIYYENKKSS